jgi:hypothetical protein
VLENRKHRAWNLAYWILLVCWIVGALLNISRFNGGFLTNYLADLAFPPWYYIYLRGLRKESEDLPKLIFFRDWFGITPERAAVSIFLVGTVTEFKTLYWPNGIVTGTFDIYDIGAYAMGLLVCYVVDRSSWKKLS